MQATGSRSLSDRLMGALKLDPATYEEIEHDSGATAQAAIIVVLAAIAGGIGAANEGIGGLVGGILAALLGWVIFAGLVYFVGTRFLATATTSASWEEVARTMGFAYTPQWLAVFGFIPVLGWILAFIGSIWALVAGIVAIRQALDFSTGRAIGTALIAWLISLVVGVIILAIFGISVG
jgi:hypothetical protein